MLCCWGAGAGVVDGVLVDGATGAAGVVGGVVVVPSGVWMSGGSPFFARRSFLCASRSASRSVRDRVRGDHEVVPDLGGVGAALDRARRRSRGAIDTVPFG